MILKVEVVTNVRSSIGPRLAISVPAPEMSFSCFKLLSATGKNPDPSKVALGTSTQVRHSHLRCLTGPKERGSPPRRTLSPLVLLATVRLGCEPDFFPPSLFLQVCNQMHVSHRQHALPTIPCPHNSSTRDHSPSAPAESEIDDQRLLQHEMSRAATRGKSAAQHTHTLPTHARSITTRRSQYPVGKEHALRPQRLPAPLWPRRPTLSFVLSLSRSLRVATCVNKNNKGCRRQHDPTLEDGSEKLSRVGTVRVPSAPQTLSDQPHSSKFQWRLKTPLHPTSRLIVAH